MSAIVRDLIVVTGLSTLLAACPRSVSPSAEPRLAAPPPDASVVSETATAPAPADASPPTEGRVSALVIDTTAWRRETSRLITFALPDGASAHEIVAAEGGQYLETDVYVSGHCPGTDEWTRRSCVSVAFQRLDGHGWNTLAEATQSWDGASTSVGFGGRTAGTNLGGGVTPEGVFYALRSFDVRTGFRGTRGQTIHRYISVSRVYADLELGDAGHVKCTGYLERKVEKPDDPEIQALLGICTSMRRAP